MSSESKHCITFHKDRPKCRRARLSVEIDIMERLTEKYLIIPNTISRTLLHLTFCFEKSKHFK